MHKGAVWRSKIRYAARITAGGCWIRLRYSWPRAAAAGWAAAKRRLEETRSSIGWAWEGLLRGGRWRRTGTAWERYRAEIEERIEKGQLGDSRS